MSAAKLLIQGEIPGSEPKKMGKLDFFDTRMNPLGITEDCELNKIRITHANDSFFDHKIFTRVPSGIQILVYSIDGYLINYKEEQKVTINERGFNIEDKQWSKNYSIVRLEHPKVKKDGSVQKYSLPKNQMVQPFFPPKLVDFYRNKTKRDTLYLTEGYIKAFHSTNCGMDCVGIPSITTLKNKTTGKLHEDVIKLILTCQYDRVVWLVDGDCRNVTSDEIKDGINLTHRPTIFFNTVTTARDLLSQLNHLSIYFSCINTDNLPDRPKGVDDLLIAYKEKATEIVSMFNDFSVIKEVNEYFYRFNITAGITNIKRFFVLDNVDNFYLFHCERRPELKGKEFKFYNTTYRYDEEKQSCVVKIPGGASRFVRIGDNYFEKQRRPDHFGSYYDVLDKRDKTTITDDYGKDIIKHITKYKGSVTIPNHVNFQPVIDGFYNSYSPITHELEDGDYSNSIEFIKHIFGTEIITLPDGKEIYRWEMGLDYLTIAWRYPWQMLPILCLVSEERQTGKTKFIEWICYMFCENAIVIGNQDLENKFNTHWKGKLFICVDETKIERLIVLERIKALSTSSFIIEEGKGTNQVKSNFFGKFILNSNNVKNFAIIDEKEIRFWVNEVPTVTNRNVNLLDILKEETPAFLSYLSRREILCPNVERHWFETRLLKTKALGIVVDNSKPTIQKIFALSLKELFNATEYLTIKMPLDGIIRDLLKNKYEKPYVLETLREMGYKSNPSARNSYPRLVEKSTASGGIELTAISVSYHTTYYEFKREDFTTEVASKNYVVGSEPPTPLPTNPDHEDIF